MVSTDIDMHTLARKLAATVIVLATLLLGVRFTAVGAGDGHDMHGAMAGAENCVMASCPADGVATEAANCLEHCIAAAAAGRNVVPAFVFSGFLLLAALVAYGLARTARALPLAHRDERIGTFLLHQQLSTIVLRN